MKSINPFTVFNRYKVDYCNYTIDKTITDTRLIVRNFKPSKNEKRATFQLAKLSGVANSLDLILSARIYLQAENICNKENVSELVHLQKQLNDIILQLYYNTPVLYENNNYAWRLKELCYIR